MFKRLSSGTSGAVLPGGITRLSWCLCLPLRWRSKQTESNKLDNVALCVTSSNSKQRAICWSDNGIEHHDRPLTMSPVTTCLKNFADRSTTSSQTWETLLSSKSVASGNDCKASKDSDRSSLQNSMSSPDLQARLRYANEKFSAARDPTRANPNVAFSFGLVIFCNLVAGFDVAGTSLVSCSLWRERAVKYRRATTNRCLNRVADNVLFATS